MRKVLLVPAVVILLLAVAPANEVAADPGVDPAFRGRPYPQCKENAGRLVTFTCLPGAAAGVGGIYGGAVFGLVCNGRDGRMSTTSTMICTVAGDHTWRLSGAAELRDGRNVRFAPAGAGRTVNYIVGNGDVRLSIHY